MRDLAIQLKHDGHDVMILTPDESLESDQIVEQIDDIPVLKVRPRRSIQGNYLSRTLAEFMLPFELWRGLQKTPFYNERWDQVIWYSPTIFFGSLIKSIKKRFDAKAYLILRDIFPEWAVDLGIIGKGPAYYFLKLVAANQYRAADIIGVQTKSNLGYMAGYAKQGGRRLEVLNNWLLGGSPTPSSIRIDQTSLRGRYIFVYTGNMGVAQDAEIFLDTAKLLQDRTDIGFLFVGRGTEFDHMQTKIQRENIDNVLLKGEIDPTEISDLLAQSHVGLVALHTAHKTHNIPGKFVSYLHAGLPVLARVNDDTDLVHMIADHDVGLAYSGDDAAIIADLVTSFVDDGAMRQRMADNAQRAAKQLFSAQSAAAQIQTAMTAGGPGFERQSQLPRSDAQ